MQSPLSVVVLTKDEETNVAECVRGVLAQLRDGDEIIVVDSASKDATVPIAETLAREDARVRVLASRTHLSFGAARNMGVGAALSDVIVFVSADAVPEQNWLKAMRAAISNADIVYGRQRHAPTTENVATVSRGLRYRHFEDSSEGLPERYASNVNAAYRRFAFESIQFDEKAAGAEDVAFAKAARLAGLRIAYAPLAIVRHKDAATLKAEWRKHLREGEAYAQLRKLLGAPTSHLAWAIVVGALLLFTLVSQRGWMWIPTTLAFLAPTLRRVISPLALRYKTLPLIGAAALSPIFDLAFLGSYMKRRWIP